MAPIARLPIRWGFSCAFPDGLRPDVREAFRYWDDLTPARLFEEVPGCGGVVPSDGILVIPVDVRYLRDDEPVAGTAYYYPWNLGQQLGGAVVLWRSWLREKERGTRVSIVRHEIGHVLLFDHNPDTPTCLMYPYINAGGHVYHVVPKGLCRSEYRAFREHY